MLIIFNELTLHIWASEGSWTESWPDIMGGQGSPASWEKKLSPSIYHCKHNCMIRDNIIICTESSWDNYACHTPYAVTCRAPSHTESRATPPTTTSKFSTCGKHCATKNQRMKLKGECHANSHFLILVSLCKWCCLVFFSFSFFICCMTDIFPALQTDNLMATYTCILQPTWWSNQVNLLSTANNMKNLRASCSWNTLSPCVYHQLFYWIFLLKGFLSLYSIMSTTRYQSAALPAMLTTETESMIYNCCTSIKCYEKWSGYLSCYSY